MEKRTEVGKARHDLGKKLWYEKKVKEKELQELKNGEALGYPGVRISNNLKNKIETGKSQILVHNGEVIRFRKKVDNGYWFNNHLGKIIYLHREKLRLFLGMTEEEMAGYDVHHIDENIDNNDITNLQLLSKSAHQKLHAVRSEDSKRHVCKKCGRTYCASVSNSIDVCNKCGG